MIWSTRKQCFLHEKLQYFFRVSTSNPKLHDFYADSLSNGRKIHKLSCELHGNRPENSVFYFDTQSIEFYETLPMFILRLFPNGELHQRSLSLVKHAVFYYVFHLFKRKLTEHGPFKG